ncbi:hypothetical protein UFOVP648_31 [uncultured Caudovirales phage]|jgi:hypothetical protein|uniref:Uncharacterized protein n=1 Tax=uncultured Caudovirales phage TaxID=2100421 RepID=A0A6J5N6Q3_9CAUD|nr:hypothetical protein UFOVP648_31 [uncultured Caudovirales phage]
MRKKGFNASIIPLTEEQLKEIEKTNREETILSKSQYVNNRMFVTDKQVKELQNACNNFLNEYQIKILNTIISFLDE